MASSLPSSSLQALEPLSGPPQWHPAGLAIFWGVLSPPGTSLQLTLPFTEFSAPPSMSLHIFRGIYQVPGPLPCHHIRVGWLLGS